MYLSVNSKLYIFVYLCMYVSIYCVAYFRETDYHLGQLLDSIFSLFPPANKMHLFKNALLLALKQHAV